MTRPADIAKARLKKDSAEAALSKTFGAVVQLLRNADIIERATGRTGGLTLNEMTADIEIDGLPLEEVHLSTLRICIEEETAKSGSRPLSPSEETLFRAAVVVGSDHKFHPVRRYLEGLTWDGVHRIDVELPMRMGVDDSLERHYLRKWCLSAARRAIAPGTKVDNALILCGPQGCGKSSLARIMGGAWFSDEGVGLDDKDGKLQLQRAWIMEWPELVAIRNARDKEAVKAFLSRSVDRFRPPYGKRVKDVPRTTVILGTTNSDAFLDDETGNRRFWPVVVKSIDVEWLQAHRDQLWAEAKAAVDAGEVHVLEPAFAILQRDHGRRFEAEDPWHDEVAQFVANRSIVRIPDILSDALNLPLERHDKGHQRRVAAILTGLGWVKTQRYIEGENTKVWVKAKGVGGADA